MRCATYWGVFVYGDDAKEPKNRGARGTHLAVLEPSGRMRVHGAFTNRDWPSFSVTWTPRDPDRNARDIGGTISRERLREIHNDDTLQHPTWPPPGGVAPGAPHEHPIWPPERGKADNRIVPAKGAKADSLRH